MKNTNIQAPASDEGGNHGSGNAASNETPSFFQKPATPQEHLKALSAEPPPVYGQIHFNSGAHYAVGDPVTPVDDGAKVKMGLGQLSNAQLVPYIQNHITLMTGNAYYPLPAPPAVSFLALFTAYETSVAAATAAESARRDAVATRDQNYAAMISAMNTRGSYVQSTSNGNRQAILSSGLGVQNSRTPVGVLPAPLALRVDLNGTVGKMILNWAAVPRARSYLMECAIASQSPLNWNLMEVGPKPTLTLNGMIVGTEYVFRIAAVGGSSGRSDWSTPVTRTAA